MKVAANIPNIKTIPIDCCVIAPAPVANASGKIPKRKDKIVIIIARKRRLPAFIAESIILTPDSLCSLANSTIRMAFLAAKATSKTGDEQDKTNLCKSI